MSRHIYKALLCVWIALLPLSALAQSSAVRRLVTQPVDIHNLVTLRGNIHPLARPEYDLGVAADDLPMERMLLVLRRGADQEAALRELLIDQQVRSSASFHKWLTPEEFGQQFGPADSDLQAVTEWLTSQGFQVAKVSTGKTVVEFSGSAGLVRQVLGTEIHKFRMNGEDYVANTSDPQIPAALAPVVAGIDSLNNFPRASSAHIVDVFSHSSPTGGTHALFTVPSSATTNVYGVVPYDFATIYNVLPLWNAGIDGTGQTIAIVAETDINYGDVQSFQNLFGLPQHSINAILNGPDPGIVANEETEAVLDVEWSGAVAKGATVDLVISQTTGATLGIDLSALYIIDNNLAPVMSESYGECEQFLGAGGNAYYYATREQGAAQGITIINSAGDAGSARCDQGGTLPAAQNGLAISGLASTPFNVAVGGTDFGDANNWAAYWNATNNSSTFASAKSYIPETTWNATCAASGVAGNCSNAANATPAGIDKLAAGGGPSSCGVWSGTDSSATCVSGYPKPAWQTGVGVPSDGVRDVPDVSLFASTGTNGSFYVICQGDAVQGNPSCQGGANWYFVGVGGTSAAAPSFAGIMALVNQKTGQRQGNANFVLYPLAAKAGAACTSNVAAITNPNCVFHDVVSGNNSVACMGGSPNCSNHSSGAYGILVDPTKTSVPAWSTSAGYDKATGLGSVNVTNLVNQWNSVSFQPTTTTLSSFPATITYGQPANLTITVTSGTGTPVGDVSLIAQLSNNQSLGIGSYTLAGGGTVSGSTTALPGGSFSVVAHYAGDGIHGASDSAAHAITVSKESSKTNVAVSSCPYSGGVCTPGVTAGTYGTFYETLAASVTNTAGQPCVSAAGAVNYPCPTGDVLLIADSGSAPLGPSDIQLDNKGGAQFSHIDMQGGSYNLTANYFGDNNYLASTSANVPVAITPAATTTTITGLPATVITNNFSPISVLVDTTSRAAAPSCCIQLLANGTSVATPGSGSGSNGTAAAYAYTVFSTVPSFPLGPSSVVAVFTGDANYTTSQSAAVNVTVTDFALSAPAGTVTIPAAGQTGTAIITVTPLYGFTGHVNLNVAGGCPLYATCTVSPASVAVSGSTAATATLSIVTFANAIPRLPSSKPWASPPVPLHLPWPWILFVLLLAALLLSFRWMPQPTRWVLILGIGGVGTWLACGGGGGGGGYTNNPPPPSGTITLSTRSVSFSAQKYGTTSATQNITVSNTGAASLQIYSVANTGINPNDFAIANGCGNALAVSATCTIGLAFTPAQTGTRTTQITISNNTLEPNPSIAVSGTGVAPQVTFNPPSLTFAPQKLGTTSPAQTITLTDSVAPLNLSAINLFGNFSQTNNCPSTLVVGAGCTISVTFTPNSVGAIQDQLQVNDDGSNSQQYVPVTGTGAPPTTISGNYTIQVSAYIGSDSHSITVPVTLQ